MDLFVENKAFYYYYHYYFFCFSFLACVASLTWHNEISYPNPVSGSVTLTGYDHYIYVFGGYDGVAISNSYKFNVNTAISREWIYIAPMPSPVYYAAACISNDGRFFIFGGKRTNNSSSHIIQNYNATSDSWNIKIPDIPSDASISDFAFSCAVDSKTGLMYLVGGYNNPSRFYSYNVSTNHITCFSPTSFQLFAHGSFVARNGKLYVFGGQYNSEPYSCSVRTYIYDISTNEWSVGGNMLEASSWFGYATDGNRFFVIGGYNGTVSLRITQIYNISEDLWGVDPRLFLSHGLHKNAVAILDTILYSIGGVNSVEDFPTNRIEVFDGIHLYGVQCDDGNLCTTNDILQNNSECRGTSNKSCPNPSDPCLNSTCDPSTGNCTVVDICGSSGILPGHLISLAVIILVFLVFFFSVAIVIYLYLKRKKTVKLFTVHSVSADLPSVPRNSHESTVAASSYSKTISALKSSLSKQSATDSLSNQPNQSPTNILKYIYSWREFDIKKIIAEGMFGTVYLAEFKNRMVAIKQLSKEDISEKDIEEFLAEAEIMRKLPVHPNVVLFLGITLPPDSLSIITDFCEGGSLSTYLDKNPKLSMSLKIQFIRDIAKGMLHLHCGIPNLEVIHRDLAARNILLKNGIALISDFGMSRLKSSSENIKQSVQSIGPLKWMSPESMYERVYSTKSDVFSFAVVMYEIITQEAPWKDLDPLKACDKVGKGHRMSIPSFCPVPLVILIERCWAHNPKDRPNFVEINNFLSTMNSKGDRSIKH